MAYQFLTALDLAKMNGSDATIGLIEENLNAAPELEVIPARFIKGTSFKGLIRTGYPSTTFRKLNVGVEPTKSSYATKTFECFYYDGQMEMDNAVATADDQGIGHALTIEADGHGRAFLLTAGKQVWYGTGSGGDSDGFPGAVQIVDPAMVIDAGGTTADTGSSVYAIAANPKFMGLLFGNQTVFQVNEWRKQTITRSSKEMTAWKNSLEGWIGAEWLSRYAVARIKKLTADSGKGLTDSLLADLHALFPIGVKPTHIFMTRRSRKQLQKSRTVTLQGQGMSRPDQPTIAPVPTEYDNVPIIATDSILDSEALTL